MKSHSLPKLNENVRFPHIWKEKRSVVCKSHALKMKNRYM